MQYINDDNLDDLFRRAADDYPLKTNAEDWGKVVNALQSANEDAGSERNRAKKKNYRKYLWLLLLLPFAWICNGTFFKNNSKETENKIAGQSAADPKNPSAGSKTKPGTIHKNTDEEAVNVNPTNSATEKKKLLQTGVSAPKPSKGLKDILSVESTDQTTPDKSNQTTNQNKIIHGHGLVSVPQKSKNKSHTPYSLTYADNKIKGGQKNKSILSTHKKTQLSDGEAVNNNISNSEPKDNIAAEENSIKPPVPETKNENPDSVNAIQKHLPDSPGKQTVQSVVKKISPGKSVVHSLYAGLVTGFDVSTVEFQTIKNTGFTAGVLLGYQINKKISIESGFLFDRKFYFTDGKYFSTKKIAVRYPITILDANGYCNMFELPINIKYNWSSTSKSSWFSTLGMSTYFMKKEEYVYNYEWAGVSPQTSPAIPYTDSSTNWFGVINLSAGYMHTLGKFGSLRVEPYIKIPVQKLGIGSLSIWSTGIYVSFVKTIF